MIMTKKNPIILIPGFTGSNLYDQEGDLVWVEYSLKLTKLGDIVNMQNTLLVKNNEIDQVSLPEGEREYGAKGPFEYTYKKIIDELCDTFPERGVYFFSYDFRQARSDSAKHLNQNIQSILRKTGASKVDLIAHSLGGLVVSTYLKTYGKEQAQKIIILATPYEGTPETLNMAITGELKYLPNGVLDVVAKLTREIRTSLPSVGELVPTYPYVSKYPAYQYTGIVPNDGESENMDTIFSEGGTYYTPAGFTQNAGMNVYEPMDRGQYKKILKTLFGHDDGLRLKNDSRIVATLKESYFIAGTNRQTIRSLIFSNETSDLKITHKIYDRSGDGYVPEDSATMYGYLKTLGKDPWGNERFLVLDEEHARIVSNTKALEWIIAILSDANTSHIESDIIIPDTSIQVKANDQQEILLKLQKLVTSIKKQNETEEK